MREIHTAYCLTVPNKNDLIMVPRNFHTYYIRYKSSYNLYFKEKEQMKEMIRKFDYNNIRYIKRTSVLPNMLEYDEFVNHTRYKRAKRQGND